MDHTDLNILELALLNNIAEKRKTEFPFIAVHIPFLKVDDRRNTGIGIFIHFS